MKKEHINEIHGIIVLATGLILLASLVSFVPEDLPWYTSNPNIPAKNFIRIVGAYLAGGMLFTFGYSSYVLVLFLLFWSWNKFASRDIRFTFTKFLSFLILFVVVSSLFSMSGPQDPQDRFLRSGLTGYICSDFLVQYIGRIGSYIILLALGSLTLVITGEILVSPLILKLTEITNQLLKSFKEKYDSRKDEYVFSTSKQRSRFKEQLDVLQKKIEPKIKDFPPLLKENFTPNKEPLSLNAAEIKKSQKPVIRIAEEKEQPAIIMDNNEPKVVGEYRLPSLDLLDTPQSIPSSKLQSDLEIGARTLEETLADFNVSARVADIERGPVITRYELEPAPGVKVQKITALADDIALVMRAQTVRIVAPIPGKNRVGVEVPNSSIATVYLKEVLAQSQFQESPSKLMLALGKDISGQSLISDLTEMPHLLIAGTTGSGKTVCVNSLIMSMLFNASPDEVKLLMVDPKMVELTAYNNIPHMLCPTVTDAKRVSAALNWVVGEMESRYSMLSQAGVRNIKTFNEQGNKLPFIVVVIDELADLMQVAAKTIESAITRLAQLSRAVGIHLILATQRPSVDVITGVIKANFPARISFKVASKVDSRTVLDMNGAENLLGKGDLLFMKPGEAKPIRGQCCYVSDKEIQRVIDFIKKQQSPIYNESILKQQSLGGPGSSEEKDELYDEAVRLVIETNQASVSILQRRMRLGYTRAARLIDMMEQNGLVGPYCGSKPRDILVNREEWLLQNMNKQQQETAGPA